MADVSLRRGLLALALCGGMKLLYYYALADLVNKLTS